MSSVQSSEGVLQVVSHLALWSRSCQCAPGLCCLWPSAPIIQRIMSLRSSHQVAGHLLVSGDTAAADTRRVASAAATFSPVSRLWFCCKG